MTKMPIGVGKFFLPRNPIPTVSSGIILPDGELRFEDSEIEVPESTEGQSFSFTVAVRGGFGLRGYNNIGTNLPTGMTLNSVTGVISGTPTVPGTYTGIIIRVTDSLGTVITSQPFTITVTSFGIEFIPTLTKPVFPGSFFTFQVETKNTIVGTPTWTSVGTALPAGVTLDPNTGILSGNIEAISLTEGIVIQFTDDNGTSLSNPFSLRFVTGDLVFVRLEYFAVDPLSSFNLGAGSPPINPINTPEGHLLGILEEFNDTLTVGQDLSPGMFEEFLASNFHKMQASFQQPELLEMSTGQAEHFPAESTDFSENLLTPPFSKTVASDSLLVVGLGMAADGGSSAKIINFEAVSPQSDDFEFGIMQIGRINSEFLYADGTALISGLGDLAVAVNRNEGAVTFQFLTTDNPVPEGSTIDAVSFGSTFYGNIVISSAFIGSTFTVNIQATDAGGVSVQTGEYLLTIIDPFEEGGGGS
jgi:hypothetical protein